MYIFSKYKYILYILNTYTKMSVVEGIMMEEKLWWNSRFSIYNFYFSFSLAVRLYFCIFFSTASSLVRWTLNSFNLLIMLLQTVWKNDLNNICILYTKTTRSLNTKKKTKVNFDLNHQAKKRYIFLLLLFRYNKYIVICIPTKSVTSKTYIYDLTTNR